MTRDPWPERLLFGLLGVALLAACCQVIVAGLRLWLVLTDYLAHN